MSAPASPFIIAKTFRLPGLGLLLLPAHPPDWLTHPPLHTALRLQLHRPNQLPLPLIATLEELAYDLQTPMRALLLDTDLTGESLAESWLTLEAVMLDRLF
jgi:hypothetical protein